MTDNRKQFADRLIAVEPHSPTSRQRLQQELHAMFVRELTTPRRVFFAIVGVVALISATVCGSLALTEPSLPTLPRVGLAVGTLFGLAWAAVAARICWRGALERRIDARRIAVMVWVFTVLMMVFFLMAGMTVEDRLLGLMLIANGLAFLIGAGVYWITYRIEQAELNTREKLLQLEVRLAELQESR
jgi:predicted membrane channel-forming protein YqfA (hemolysin III family)